MRDDDFDALVRRALHENSWEPDLTAAELDFARRIAAEPSAAVVRPLVPRPTDWESVTGRRLSWVTTAAAAAAAVVALALAVGPARLGSDTLTTLRNPPLASAGDAPPKRTAPVPAPSDAQSEGETVDPAPARPADPPKLAPSDTPPQAAKPAPPPPPPPPPSPSPAPTEVQRYTASQVCGSDFAVINQHRLPRSVVYLLWNAATKENCVVTLKTANVGEPTTTSAYLRPDGAAETRDNGNYRYYANVTARAPACIQWGGSDGSGTFTSPTGVHCSS